MPHVAMGQASKAEQLATMLPIKAITAPRSTLVLAALWIVVVQASNSDGSTEILDLSSAALCSPSATSSDSLCGECLIH